MTSRCLPSRRSLLALATWPLVAGAATRRELEVPAFRRLRVGGALAVELVQRQPPKVLIESDGDTPDRIEARVEEGELTLHDGGQRRPAGLRIVVQVWALERLDLSGSAVLGADELVAKRLAVDASGSSVLRLDRLTTELLSLQCSGSASLRVAGRANELELSMGGSAQLQAADFEVRRVGVKLGGSAGARLWAADALDGAIGGSAQLRYRGSPAVQVARGGSARVAPLE